MKPLLEGLQRRGLKVAWQGDGRRSKEAYEEAHLYNMSTAFIIECMIRYGGRTAFGPTTVV